MMIPRKSNWSPLLTGPKMVSSWSSRARKFVSISMARVSSSLTNRGTTRVSLNLPQILA